MGESRLSGSVFRAPATKPLPPAAARLVAETFCYGAVPGALCRGIDSAFGAQLEGHLNPAVVVKLRGL